MEPDQRKALKKRLGEGMIIPAASGVLLATCDIEEYRQSKAIGGFVHQMPITLHVYGGGAGQSDEYVSRYMSVEEAKMLVVLLNASIKELEADDKSSNNTEASNE